MSANYSASQFEDAFSPRRLGNWESNNCNYRWPGKLALYGSKNANQLGSSSNGRPTRRGNHHQRKQLQFIADDQGHLLPHVPKNQFSNPWGSLTLYSPSVWDHRHKLRKPGRVREFNLKVREQNKPKPYEIESPPKPPPKKTKLPIFYKRRLDEAKARGDANCDADGNYNKAYRNDSQSSLRAQPGSATESESCEIIPKSKVRGKSYGKTTTTAATTPSSRATTASVPSPSPSVSSITSSRARSLEKTCLDFDDLSDNEQQQQLLRQQLYEFQNQKGRANPGGTGTGTTTAGRARSSHSCTFLNQNQNPGRNPQASHQTPVQNEATERALRRFTQNLRNYDDGDYCSDDEQEIPIPGGEGDMNAELNPINAKLRPPSDFEDPDLDESDEIEPATSSPCDYEDDFESALESDD